jgi:uncharacterized protein (TIGR02117 family)
MRAMMRQRQRIARAIGDVMAVLACLFVAYGAAGMIGGAIPANAGWHQPTNGVRIYVDSNGVHSGIIVPVAADGVDWRDLVRPTDIGDPRYADYGFIEIGWGERTFYLETPTWRDVKPMTVVRAAIGSNRTLVHVDHLPEPQTSDSARAITLTPDQYHRLAAAIRASFAAGGRHYRGYGDWDAFYDGTGRYSAFETCNAWTGDMLRTAGVRVGVWTPFPVTVLGWF